MKHTSLLVPAGLGGGNDVGGDVGDVVLGETSTEGGHGVLAVGDLGDDGGLLAAAGEVLVEGLLLEGLLGHDDVLSAGVASGAVGVEDLLTGSDVTGEGGGGDAEGEGAGDGTDLGGLLFWSDECRENEKEREISGKRKNIFDISTRCANSLRSTALSLPTAYPSGHRRISVPAIGLRLTQCAVGSLRRDDEHNPFVLFRLVRRQSQYQTQSACNSPPHFNLSVFSPCLTVQDI